MPDCAETAVADGANLRRRRGLAAGIAGFHLRVEVVAENDYPPSFWNDFFDYIKIRRFSIQ